jgi:hypothetical protein
MKHDLEEGEEEFVYVVGRKVKGNEITRKMKT